MTEPEEEIRQATDKLRVALMELTETTIAPFHEWVTGEVTYFIGQGFTKEQSYAMAAAEYVTALGGKIEGGATRPDDTE